MKYLTFAQPFNGVYTLYCDHFLPDLMFCVSGKSQTRTFDSAFMLLPVTAVRRKQLPNPNKIKLRDITKVKTDLHFKSFWYWKYGTTMKVWAEFQV